MRKYTKLNPTFMNEIMITETGDPGHADNINAGPKQIFENTLANKEEIEKGDSQNRIVTFTSNDNADAQSWTDVAVMESGEKHKNLFEKISTMFKNVRYLYRLLGTTDISAIQNGTVTGILNELDRVAFTGIYSDLHNKPLSLPASDVYSWAKQATKPSYAKSEVGLGKVDNTSDKDKPVSTEQQTALDKKVNFADISRSTAVNIAGKKVLDAMEKNALVEGTLAHDISQIYSNLKTYGLLYPGNNVNIKIRINQCSLVIVVDGFNNRGALFLIGECYFSPRVFSVFNTLTDAIVVTPENVIEDIANFTIQLDTNYNAACAYCIFNCINVQ